MRSNIRERGGGISVSGSIRNNRATIVAGILIALALVVVCLFVFARPSSEGPLQALVHDGDGQTHTLELNAGTTLVVETSHGANTIEVSSGAVRVVDADCPNGDCLRQSAISEPGQQLICLPHQLWVEIVPEGGAPSELDIDAVRTEDAGSKSVDAVSR